MSVIDSLKRLERAGSEHSETNIKLRQAAKDLAIHLAKIMPEEIEPIDALWCQVGRHDVVVFSGNDHADYLLSYELPDLYGAREFARAVADGLLGLVADELERQVTEDRAATEDLVATVNALRMASPKAVTC